MSLSYRRAGFSATAGLYCLFSYLNFNEVMPY